MDSCAQHPNVHKVVDIDPTKPLVIIKLNGKDNEETDVADNEGDNKSGEKRRKKRKLNVAKTQQRQHDDQVRTKKSPVLQVYYKTDAEATFLDAVRAAQG